jgi:hypothetical protein
MLEDNFNVNADQLQRILAQICDEKNIRPTDYAQRFLLVAAEGFLIESSMQAKKEMSPQAWFDIGKAILTQALDDPRTRKEMKQRGQVSFSTLLHTVADAGYNRLAMIGFK